MARHNKKNGTANARDSYRNNRASDVINNLVTGDTDASHLLELYYWSREPGLMELIHAYLALPERSQRTLIEFLHKAKPQTTELTVDESGRLVRAQTGKNLERVRTKSEQHIGV